MKFENPGETVMFIGKHSDITEKVLGAFYSVYNEMGYGFFEKVYENALAFELNRLGFKVEQQKPINVYYGGEVVGEYFSDILVDEVVILELKSVKQVLPEHEAQLISYLKASLVEVGLLLNFGPKSVTVRKVFDNERNGSLTWIPKGQNG